MEQYLPYIISIGGSILSFFASFFASRSQMKAELKKLQKQHELEIEMEREKFQHEKEKMELEHQHQLELMQKERDNKVGIEFISTVTKEYMNTPEAKAAIRQSVSKSRKKRGTRK